MKEPPQMMAKRLIKSQMHKYPKIFNRYDYFSIL